MKEFVVSGLMTIEFNKVIKADNLNSAFEAAKNLKYFEFDDVDFAEDYTHLRIYFVKEK